MGDCSGQCAVSIQVPGNNTLFTLTAVQSRRSRITTRACASVSEVKSQTADRIVGLRYWNTLCSTQYSTLEILISKG